MVVCCGELGFVVPPQGRQQVLAELHESQPGINKMKGLARGYVWWPNMDKEIDVVKQCDTCQSSRFLPPVPSMGMAPMNPGLGYILILQGYLWVTYFGVE